MAKRRRSNYRRSPYRMTPARARAIKKAQEASARKRRNKRIRRAAVVGITVAGVGTGAVLGVKYGGRGKRTVAASVRNGQWSAANIQKRQADLKAKFDPKNKEYTRTKEPQVSGTSPNVIGAAKNKRAGVRKPGRFNQYNYGDKPAYNVDRFINKDILYGRKLKRGSALRPKYINRQIEKHQLNKGKLTGKSVDGNKIIKDMIADGTVRGRISGRRTKTKTNRQVAGTGQPKKPRQNLQQKAFEQWLKDNPDA